MDTTVGLQQDLQLTTTVVKESVAPPQLQLLNNTDCVSSFYTPLSFQLL